MSSLFKLHAAATAFVSVWLLALWAAAGWPLWACFQLAVALALHFALVRAWPDPRRVHVALSAVAAGTVISVWVLWSGGWWIVWPLLGLALALAAHDVARGLARRGPLAVHAGVAGCALGVTALAWALSGAGAWIVWPVLGVGSALAAHAVCREHARLR
jgi:hypothetical protein